MSLAIYPGSFDPLTNGHLDVALRAARLFDTLIIGIYEGSNKPGAMFDIPSRVKLARMAIAESGDPLAERILVERFSGLAVTYARDKGAVALVRGLRAVSDFEYEFQYAHMNEHLAPEIEVVSLMTSSSTSFISSSFIREVASLGGSLDGLVPECVERALRDATGNYAGRRPLSQERDIHMSQPPRVRNEQESAPELVYNIDLLEDLVSNGKRVPMSHKVMVDEDEFIHLLDEIRSSIPMEIRDAQRLLKERERLIGEAQEQAGRIVGDAQRRASVLVSEHTVLAEAKQHAEELLRASEKKRQEEQGRMEVFMLQQLDAIGKAAYYTMSNMEATVEKALDALENAKSAIGAELDPSDQ